MVQARRSRAVTKLAGRNHQLTQGDSTMQGDSMLIQGFKELGSGGGARVYLGGKPLTHVVHHSPTGLDWGIQRKRPG